MDYKFSELTPEEKEVLFKILKTKSNETMKLYQKAKKGEKLEFTKEEYSDSLQIITNIMLKLGF